METKKVEVDLSSAYRLLHPQLTVLVSCVDRAGKANIITLAWAMPVSASPPLLVVSIALRRHSHRLIMETKEFVVNIPTMEFVKETLFCGRRSGRKYDKFKEMGFTPSPAKMVRAPIIKECVAHLECKVHRRITAGDHSLFVGEILTAYANEGSFKRKKYDIKTVKPVYHLGANYFATLAPKVVRPRLPSQNR